MEKNTNSNIDNNQDTQDEQLPDFDKNLLLQLEKELFKMEIQHEVKKQSSKNYQLKQQQNQSPSKSSNDQKLCTGTDTNADDDPAQKISSDILSYFRDFVQNDPLAEETRDVSKKSPDINEEEEQNNTNKYPYSTKNLIDNGYQNTNQQKEFENDDLILQMQQEEQEMFEYYYNKLKEQQKQGAKEEEVQSSNQNLQVRSTQLEEEDAQYTNEQQVRENLQKDYDQDEEIPFVIQKTQDLEESQQQFQQQVKTISSKTCHTSVIEQDYIGNQPRELFNKNILDILRLQLSNMGIPDDLLEETQNEFMENQKKKSINKITTNPNIKKESKNTKDQLQKNNAFDNNNHPNQHDEPKEKQITNDSRIKIKQQVQGNDQQVKEKVKKDLNQEDDQSQQQYHNYNQQNQQEEEFAEQQEPQQQQIQEIPEEDEEDINDGETVDSEVQNHNFVKEIQREDLTKEGDKDRTFRIKYSNGDIYEGEIDASNQLKDGYGVYFYSSGEKYDGFFQDDIIYGYGKYWFLGGHMYDGEWVKGKKHGPGALQFSNNDKYIGYFQNDTFEGEGEIQYHNGDKFEGLFKNGKRNGYGKFYGAGKKGRRMFGVWKEDELVGF